MSEFTSNAPSLQRSFPPPLCFTAPDNGRHRVIRLYALGHIGLLDR